MKKFFLSLAAIAALFATSCVKEESGNNANQELKLIPYSFTAGVDETEDTKAGILDPAAKTLTWNVGDEIKIFDGIANNLKYTTDLTADAARATFSGMITEGQSPLCALYPYQENANYADGKITASIPAEQIAREGNFPREAAIATGTPTAEDKVTFYFIGSFIKFTLPEGISDGKTIESVTFSGNNNEPLTGKFTSEPNADGNGGRKTAVPVTGETSPTVTLTGDIQEGKEYLASVFQCKLSKGYTLSVLFSDGTRKYIRTTTALSQTNRGGVLKLLKGAAANNFKSTMPNDLFIAWIHGFDLVNNNGIRVNKTTHTYEAVLVTANDKLIPKEKTIYFIDSNRSLDGTVTKNIFSSRYANKQYTLSRDPYLNIALNEATDATGVLVMKNIHFTATQSGYLMTAGGNCKGTVELVAFDGCKFELTSSQNLINIGGYKNQSSTYENRITKNFILVNSSISIGNGSNNNGILYTNNNTDTTIDNLIFDNNLIYCPNQNDTRYRFAGMTNKTTTVNNFVFTHNTVCDWIMSIQPCYAKEVGEAIISNNLLYFTDPTGNNAVTGTTAILRCETTYPKELSTTSNISTYLGETASRLQCCYTVQPNEQMDNKKASESTSILGESYETSMKNGTFVSADENFGAKPIEFVTE